MNAGRGQRQVRTARLQVHGGFALPVRMEIQKRLRHASNTMAVREVAVPLYLLVRVEVGKLLGGVLRILELLAARPAWVGGRR